MGKSKQTLFYTGLLFIITSLLNFKFSIIYDKFQIFILLGLLIYLIYTLGIDLKKSINNTQVLRILLIYIFSYFIIIYLSGLLIGFEKTIYSHTIVNLIKNILPVTIIIVLSELLRFEFINKSNNNKFFIVLATVMLILFEFSSNINMYNLSISNEIYEYIGLVVLGSITKNIFLTYLCSKTKFHIPIVYRLFMEIYIYIVPIVPSFGPYITSVINIIFPILLMIVVLSILKKKINEKPSNGKKHIIINAFIIIILLIVIALNSGFFKYQSIVIGSNSMKEYMSKGDVIIIQKKDIGKIDKGKIIVFRYDNKLISHRVYEVINKNGEEYYKTKGDNNKQVDEHIVYEKDIVGMVKNRIKYIGLPSIWLQERVVK